jgi:type I restriction enzyme M protein
MFVQSARFIQEHQGSIDSVSVFGQDSNSTTWKLCRMNLAIRGIEANLGAYAADTFHNDLHRTLKADYILANPPFNLSGWGGEQLKDDYRWRYGVPPTGNANFAWLQHMIAHMSVEGRVGMVLANGSLSSQSSGEGDIRRRIIEDDLVECIIAMPPQLFYTTQIPVSLWFLSKKKERSGEILFIDAREMGTMVTRKLREMTEDDIARLAQTVTDFRNDVFEDEKGYCKAVDLEEIAKNDFILTPGRYVGIAEQEDDGEPFDEKMKRLTGELGELFEKSHELEKKVRENLGAIGYGI